MIMMGESIRQIWVNLPTLSILGLSCRPTTSAEIYELVREKTINLGSDHVRRGGSNEYPQSMFWSKNKKK